MTNQEIADFLAGVMGWHKDGDGFWTSAVGRGAYIQDYDPATDLNQAAQAAEELGDYSISAHRRLHVYYASVAADSGDGFHQSTIGPAHALSLAVVKAAGGIP